MDFFFYIDKLNHKVTRYVAKCHGNFKVMALKLIFWNFKCLFRFSRVSSFKDEKLHVLFKPMGELGDHIYFLKYHACFLRRFTENVEADILLTEDDEKVLPLYQAGLENIRNVFFKTTKKQYDVHIQITRFPLVTFYDEKRMAGPRFAAIKRYVDSLCLFYQENYLLYLSDFLGRHYSMRCGRTRENQADVNNLLSMKDYTFSLCFPANDAAILTQFHLVEDEFIVVQRGPGHHFKDERNDVRQWSLEYYTELIRLLHQSYPRYQIVQLGETYQEAIPGIEQNLLGKTNMIEMLVLLRNAKLLIAQEGGMAVCRHFMARKPSCILFGPTDIASFGFPENINISANICPGCEWLTANWYRKCLVSGGKAKCMTAITPRYVMAHLKGILAHAPQQDSVGN